MKKLILLALCLTLLSGCAYMLNSEQEWHGTHSSEQGKDSDSDPMTVDVKNYYALRQALLNFVKNYQEEGIVRFVSYSGDAEADLNNACIYLTNDSALGSYCVRYASGSISRIVSYYEATVSITYKRTAEEIKSIITADSTDTVQEIIRNMLDTCAETAVISTSGYSINQDTFFKALDQEYYGDPKLVVAMPEMTLEQYTDGSNYGKERIYEVTMEYPKEPSIMLGYRKVFDSSLEQIGLRLSDTEDSAEMLYQLCRYLADNVNYVSDVSDEVYDRADLVNTAYGALYEREASAEGFAMALKLLCDWKNIECVVVTGRYNNHLHPWNMIKVDGDWYHFDVTRLNDDPSEALMLNDWDMAGEYSWDVGAYNVCRGELDYTYLTERGMPSEVDEQE